MKRKYFTRRHSFMLSFVFISLAGNYFSQTKNGEQLIEKMWKARYRKVAQTVSFVQTTKVYAGDTVAKISTWYEHIKYPDKFRIDFDSFPSARAAIFRNDSQFVISKGVLVKAQPEKNELLLLLGGMYFRKFPEVIKRLAELDFDLSFLRDTVFENKHYSVIGKTGGKQIWIDANELRVKRIIAQENGTVQLDAIIEEWAKSGKGWMEKKISFYAGGKKIQSEEYNTIQLNRPIADDLFNPATKKK